MEDLTDKGRNAILFAILAALFYGVSSPLSKLLLVKIPPTFLAALLYLGAGLGMSLVNLTRRASARQSEAPITAKELPYVGGMILLDIAAPILLMFGLTLTTPANVSLLNNFEIVATALIALFLFREPIGRRMWLAIGLITLSSLILSFEDASSLSFSTGSLLVLLASLCWGFENNFTRKLSIKDPLQIVVIKGIGSGLGALLIAIFTHELSVNWIYIVLAMLLGFFAYGLSIYFYIRAQRDLGAARTSAYYAVAPFIGVGLSMLVYRQPITLAFASALATMLLGTYFTVFERHSHLHTHEVLTHEHRHHHDDGHHNHTHDYPVTEHSHVHTHEALTHAHVHTPDVHHQHSHQ